MLECRLISDVHYSGGPAGLVYGYFLTWIGTLAVFVTLGELASMYASQTMTNTLS